jgi:hypothetical protein
MSNDSMVVQAMNKCEEVGKESTYGEVIRSNPYKPMISCV